MSSNSHSEGVESQPQATLCSGGCGFFANVGTSGLCSKCYRETEQTQQKLDAVLEQTVQKAAAAAVARPSLASASSPAVAEGLLSEATHPIPPTVAAQQPSAPEVASSEAPGGAPSTPSRCTVEACRKKVGLTGFKCRCGHFYCGQHRHAESHACTFDWKTFGRLNIAANNPTIQGSKIQKI